MASRKPQMVNGARQEQVSAVIGYFGALICPETTNIDFFQVCGDHIPGCIKKKPEPIPAMKISIQ